MDYAHEHWPGPPADAIGHWTTVIPAPKHGAATKVDPEALMRFFEQLSEEASLNQDQARYAAALLLLKHKKLKLNDVRHDDDGTWLMLEGMHGEGVYEVRNLTLTDEETSRLQQTLKLQLATEWS